jgi:hypothetical protein
MKKLTLSLAAIGTLSLLALTPSKAQIIITEVDPTGSSTGTYAADWFELTNYGSSAVNISGWVMDDSHDNSASGTAAALTGVGSINAGQSVVFVESTGTTASAVTTAFENAWFGSTANAPAGFMIGTYAASSVGLSSGGDAVNIFSGFGGTLEAGVKFGSSTSNVTFDNSSLKITNSGASTGSDDSSISTLSVVGTNGAFKDAGNEIGSPGAVPEPSSWALALLVAGGFAMLVRQQKAPRA